MSSATIKALSTVKQFPQKNPAFTEGGLRSLIFNEQSNGLAESGAIIRIGRKILIDEVKFFAWIEGNNKPSPPHRTRDIKTPGLPSQPRQQSQQA
ncbi:MAG: hypothetical protein WAW61_15605 [Methylococcaceae bacterium]